MPSCRPEAFGPTCISPNILATFVCPVIDETSADFTVRCSVPGANLSDRIWPVETVATEGASDLSGERFIHQGFLAIVVLLPRERV